MNSRLSVSPRLFASPGGLGRPSPGSTRKVDVHKHARDIYAHHTAAPLKVICKKHKIMLEPEEQIVGAMQRKLVENLFEQTMTAGTDVFDQRLRVEDMEARLQQCIADCGREKDEKIKTLEDKIHRLTQVSSELSDSRSDLEVVKLQVQELVKATHKQQQAEKVTSGPAQQEWQTVKRKVQHQVIREVSKLTAEQQ